MVLHSFLFFIICEFSLFLQKDSRVTSSCHLYSLEFRVLLIFDALTSKAKEPSLSCYLTHSSPAMKEKRQIHAFTKGISMKVNVTG